jgi:cobalt/nickel transport system permease protein
MPVPHHAVHHRHLVVDGHSIVHRLAPEAKLAALVVFVVAVAVTPRHAVAAFVVEAAVLCGVFVAARLPAGVLMRLLVVVPFVLFAVFVPFIAGGEQVDVLSIGLSVEGLWATWNIVAKACLGTLASVIVSATTPLPDVLHGLGRLRMPAVVVAIIAFMFRYLELLSGQLQRMRTAMTARCHDPRWLWQARPVASSVGVLFVRSYERGERTHQAMLARGYDGTMPDLDSRHATYRDWVLASIPATIALAASLAALTMGFT